MSKGRGGTCSSTKPAVGSEEAIDEGKVERLIQTLCAGLALGQATGDQELGRKLEGAIMNFNGWSRTSPDFRRKVAGFLNDITNDMICETFEVYPKQHFLKRVVDMGIYTPVLVDYFLKEDMETAENLYPINVNAYEIKNGERETLLDYIDAILVDGRKRTASGSGQAYDVSEIKELREMLVTFFDAKLGSDLELEE